MTRAAKDHIPGGYWATCHVTPNTSGNRETTLRNLADISGSR